MRRFAFILLSTIVLMVPQLTYAQNNDVSNIKAMIDKLEADWNRGDMKEFATGYKNSPDIIIMGKTIKKGFLEMLASYNREYPTRERMGKIFFSAVEVQPLDEKFATLTGRFHLDNYDNTTNDGYFLVVAEKTVEGWKIVRDDSTVLPNPKMK